MSRSFWVPKMLAAILSIKIEFLFSLFCSSRSCPAQAGNRGSVRRHAQVQTIELSMFQSYSPERRIGSVLGLCR